MSHLGTNVAVCNCDMCKFLNICYGGRLTDEGKIFCLKDELDKAGILKEVERSL